MATYKIDSSLLTAQADEIRTLNGTTATMNPSEMTTALQSANAEVAEQEQKIIEITEMLQGKAMGGSGTSVDTCTVTLNTTFGTGPVSAILCNTAYVKYVDGEVKTIYLNVDQVDKSQMVLDGVVCGSMLCSEWEGTLSTAVGATMLYRPEVHTAIYSIDAGPGEMATITYAGE